MSCLELQQPYWGLEDTLEDRSYTKDYKGERYKDQRNTDDITELYYQL